ncbi:hypothetical protein ACHAWF_002124 [Thalassiosira exigua]
MKNMISFLLNVLSCIPVLRCRQASGFVFVQPLPLTAIKAHNERGRTILPSAAAKEEDERSIELAENLLRSLRQRTSSPAPLNLETDFYDPTTGLHSEGVWHNCLAGAASVKLAELQKHDDDGREENLSAALHIADSLWEHSWDGVSFQRRSWSGLWDHSRLEEGAPDPPEQPDYYRESAEHRCVQHGAAVLFFSKLVRHRALRSGDGELCYRCRAQYKLIAKQFLHEYWDESTKRWRTVGKSQGGGTVSRKSASSGKLTAGVVDVEAPYYRAVDQAIGLLACLEMQKDGDDSVTEIIRSTCRTLLFDFGYQSEKENVSYIGLNRNRNLWHDGWAALALASCAQACPNCFPEKIDAEREVESMLGQLQEIYLDEDSGTMWHWPKAQKSGHESGNVRYCGDNSLWYAISRAWQRGANDSDGAHNSFWDFVHELQSNSDDGLVSVADVYPQVRLHPNTELVCLLLWPI